MWFYHGYKTTILDHSYLLGIIKTPKTWLNTMVYHGKNTVVLGYGKTSCFLAWFTYGYTTMIMVKT